MKLNSLARLPVSKVTEGEGLKKLVGVVCVESSTFNQIHVSLWLSSSTVKSLKYGCVQSHSICFFYHLYVGSNISSYRGVMVNLRA